MTDLNRWHLDVKEGRQRWVYATPEEGARDVQNVVDKYLLGLDTVRLARPIRHTLTQSPRRAP